ncbi:MAG: type II secretion system F family protein [Eubacteriales bacterium]|nr:type II secretion system F family protein [Eubacteriales bacterium]
MSDTKKPPLLPPVEVALFYEQAAMLLSAGIPLSDGMETLCAGYGDSPFARVFERIANRVKISKLHSALSEAGVFPPYMTSMVRIGERTGRLEEVLRMLSRYYTWESEIGKAIQNAVIYPAVLILMLAAVVGVLVATVLPVFDRVYAGLGLSASQAGGAAIVGRVTLLVIGAALVFAIVILLLLRTNARERVLALLSRTFPPFGRVMRYLAAARFSSAIAIMLNGGYDIDEALRLSTDVAPDARARAATQACRESMQQGAGFAQAVAALGFFDPLHNKMLVVGETTGRLDSAMEKLASVYQTEADQGVYYLVSLIEPLLVALLSIVIGGILLSVMLPMLNVLSAML